MRMALLASVLGVVVCASGCGDKEPGTGSPGSDGGWVEPADGGESDGGGTPVDAGWAAVRPAACSEAENRKAMALDPFTTGFSVGVFPRLTPGFSAAARVDSYQENMTVIILVSEARQRYEVRWPSVVGDFKVGSRVYLEQTRDWTIIRQDDDTWLSAMHHHIGDIPAAALEPLSWDVPPLRHAMQCNVSDQGKDCQIDAIGLEAGVGAEAQMIVSGDGAVIGRWSIRHRSMLRTGGCAPSGVFASLISFDGRP